MKKLLLIILSLFLLTNVCNATLRQIRKFEFFNNSGGLNDKVSPLIIDDTEASDIQNVNFTVGGAIQKRNGYASDNNTLLIGTPTGLFQYVQNDGTEFLITTAGSKIYKMDDLDGTFDDITGAVTIASSSTTLFDFVIASNSVYCTNQTNPVISWAGTGNVSAVTAAPQGKWIGYHQNILFIANQSSFPSRIQFSNVVDPGTWTSTDWIDIGKGDGSGINGLAVLLDTLYIFKENAIYRLSGTNRDDFVLSRMVTDVGCTSGHSIQVINNKIIFQAKDGIYIYDGGINIRKISSKIDATVDDLVATRNQFSVSGNFKRLTQYWLSVTSGSGTKHNLILVYDYFNDAWTKYTGIDANAMTTLNDNDDVEQLFTGSAATQSVYKQDSGTSDDGGAIDAFYTTKWYRFPEIIQSDKVLRLIRVFVEDSGNWNLTVEAKQDFAVSTFSDILNLDSGGAKWGAGIWGTSVWGGTSVIVGRFNVGLRKNFFQLTFSNPNADEPFKILGFELFVESLDRV